MKTTVRLLLLATAGSAVLSLAALAADSASATPPPPPPREGRGAGPRGAMLHPEARLARMADNLQLTEEQKKQILPILQADAAKLRAMREEAQADRAERREAAMQIMEESRAKIDAVLTPEQRAKWEKHRAEQMKRLREHRAGRAD